MRMSSLYLQHVAAAAVAAAAALATFVWSKSFLGGGIVAIYCYIHAHMGGGVKMMCVFTLQIFVVLVDDFPLSDHGYMYIALYSRISIYLAIYLYGRSGLCVRIKIFSYRYQK